MTDLSNIPFKVDGDLVTALEFNKILAALRELQPKPTLGQSTISNGVVTQNFIPWQWTAVPHATNYILKEGNTVIYNGPGLSANQTGLNANSTHNVTLTAQAENYIDSVSSGSAATAGLPQLSSPELTVTNITQNSFHVSIQPVANATNYVYLVNGSIVHSGNDLSFDVTQLAAGTNYSVGVYAAASNYTNSNAAVTNTITGAYIPTYNQTLTNGLSASGVTLTALDGVQFKFSTPLPLGDPLPASMGLYIGGMQIGQVDFNVPDIGQPCSVIYNGTVYQFTFQNTPTVNLS